MTRRLAAVHCLACGARLPRRWWQWGLLAPVPLCSWRPASARACRDRAHIGHRR